MTTAFTERIQTTVDAHSVQFLTTAAVELKDLVAWRDLPDVTEGDLGKLAAPLSSNADAAAEGHQHVAAVLAAVEAFVGVAPHAVDGVDSLGLSEDILECDLQVVVDIVRITVYKIDLCHG